MKKSITLFWKGLTGILSGIANWFTTILGMKDESKYGKFLRRTVGTCFALVTVCATTIFLFLVGYHAYYNIHHYFRCGDNTYFSSVYLSHGATFYEDWKCKDGYVADANGKKTIKGIQWIAKPLGEDSLVCYSDGSKRGYFNMFTGEPVIKPTFKHAWIFSDGLAAVEIDGWIKFIDGTGKVVIDPHIPYMQEKEGYVFHNGLCAVHNEKFDRLGLMDKQGKWQLAPEYFSIVPIDTLWIVDKGKEQAVLNAHLQEVIPYMAADYSLSDGIIQAKMDDHTIRTYSLQGELIEDFHISDVDKLMYQTNEVFYTTSKIYNDEGDVESESTDCDPAFRQAAAQCLRYQAAYGWYGLMSPDGKVLTPPAYDDITAIAPDLYLCKVGDDQGVILNSKGQRVK